MLKFLVLQALYIYDISRLRVKSPDLTWTPLVASSPRHWYQLLDTGHQTVSLSVHQVAGKWRGGAATASFATALHLERLRTFKQLEWNCVNSALQMTSLQSAPLVCTFIATFHRPVTRNKLRLHWPSGTTLKETCPNKPVNNGHILTLSVPN
jgi:hypothetical protein